MRIADKWDQAKRKGIIWAIDSFSIVDSFSRQKSVSQHFCIVASSVFICFMLKLKMSTSVWTSLGWIQLYWTAPLSAVVHCAYIHLTVNELLLFKRSYKYMPGRGLQIFQRKLVCTVLQSVCTFCSSAAEAAILIDYVWSGTNLPRATIPPNNVHSQNSQAWAHLPVFANLTNWFSFPICINFVWLSIIYCSRADQDAFLSESRH